MNAVVRSETWSCHALVASTFRQKLIGLSGAPEGAAMLFRSRSVHGFGMGRPLVVVGIDRHHQVVASRTLRPNRVVYFRGARYLLEMPVGTPPPPPGARVSIEHV